MDENKQALNEQVGEDANLDTTPVAEQEASGEVAEPTGATEGEATETDGENKRSAQNRIRELNSKAKTEAQARVAAEDRAKSLEEKLAELTSPVGLPGQMPYNPQEPIAQPGEELDANEFQRRVLAQADARTELRIRQSEAVNRIQNEAGAVIREYPELDPDSEHFNKDLSESITEATEAMVKANPYTASVKKFVAKLMKPYKGAVDKEVGQATENIARQVSQAALRPTSVRKQEKTASEKSIAELERDLGIVNS